MLEIAAKHVHVGYGGRDQFIDRLILNYMYNWEIIAATLYLYTETENLPKWWETNRLAGGTRGDENDFQVAINYNV